MAEQLDEIPEWTVSEQFLEEKLRKKNHTQMKNQDGEDLVDGLLPEDTEPEAPDAGEEVPVNYLPGETRTADDREENISNTLDIPEEMDVEDLMEEVHSDSKVSASLATPDVPEKTDWNTLSVFPDGEAADVDPSDDEYELSSLLERLDLTENIRRMNESAQEDIADVIERESEPIELSAAVPAVVEDADDTGSDEEQTDLEILTADQPVNELEFDLYDESETSVIDGDKLPRYTKPDFTLESTESDQVSEEDGMGISEYDMVPTIDELEKKWKKDVSAQEKQEDHLTSEVIQPEETESEEESSNGFAYSLTDIMPASTASAPELHEENDDSDIVPVPKKTVSFEVLPDRQSVHTEEIIKKSGGARRTYHRIVL